MNRLALPMRRVNSWSSLADVTPAQDLALSRVVKLLFTALRRFGALLRGLYFLGLFRLAIVAYIRLTALRRFGERFSRGFCSYVLEAMRIGISDSLANRYLNHAIFVGLIRYSSMAEASAVLRTLKPDFRHR